MGLEGGVQALDATTGKPLWFFATGASVRHPIATADTIYAPAERIFAIDARTGQQRWSRKVHRSNDPRLALANGRLYVGAPYPPDELYVLDAATGEVQATWTIPMPGGPKKGSEQDSGQLNIGVGPVIADGVLYCRRNGAGYDLCAVDLRTGTLLWTQPTPRPVNPVGETFTIADGIILIPHAGGLMAVH